MKVLVTGSSGQLARSLVERAACRANVEVITVGRPELDLEIGGSAARAIAAAAPDVIINAGAYTAVDEAEDELERAFRVNADGAGEVAAAAAKAGAPIIQISTDYVFDGRKEEGYREDDGTNPLGVYGRSKLEGENRVRATMRDHLILRTAWVYSPWGRNFVRTVIAAGAHSDVLKVVHDQRGNPTSALDLAEALINILKLWSRGDHMGLGSTYHLAGTGETTWCSFARAVMDECGRVGLPTAEIQPIRTVDWPTRARRPANSSLDCTKFEADFGFAMPEWSSSLGAVVGRLAAEGA